MSSAIGIIRKISLSEVRPQRPSPFLIRSLPGRERVLQGVRGTSQNWRRFGIWDSSADVFPTTGQKRGVLIDDTAVIYTNRDRLVTYTAVINLS